MKRITNLPQSVLQQVLSTAQTRPATLSTDELAYAGRIKACCICRHLWVQRFKVSPRRCPACHSTAWNRPMIRALAQAEASTSSARKQEAKQ